MTRGERDFAFVPCFDGFVRVKIRTWPQRAALIALDGRPIAFCMPKFDIFGAAERAGK